MSIAIKDFAAGTERVIEEEWRMMGYMAHSEQSATGFTGYKIIGVHGYAQQNLHITHLGFILLAE